MIKIVKNPGNGRLNNLNDPVLSVLIIKVKVILEHAMKAQRVSRGITPSSTTRVFGEYFLKISVHKNS